MPVGFDSRFEKNTNAFSNPFTFVSSAGSVAGTVNNNSNRVLVGVFTARSNLAGIGTLTMQWNGTTMTQINSLAISITHCMFVCILAAPATGSNSLSASWTGAYSSGEVSLGAVSLYDAQQSPEYSDYTTNTGSVTPASLTVPNVAADDISVAFETDVGATTTTLTAGQMAWTSHWAADNFNGSWRGGSGVYSWTLGSNELWGVAGVRIIAAVVAGQTKLLKRQ